MMASQPGTGPAQPETNAATTSEQLLVDLVIVSPSVAVPQPLRFPGTPASITIKQLKAKIRETVALHPTEENQRLIHRGRALVRDADTLLEILGAEAITTDRQQTMHLVIRDISTTAQAPTQPQPAPTPAARDPSPASANGQQGQRPYAPSPQQQYLNMVQRRMLQANRDAMSQAINQNQRGRAQMGMRGIGDGATAQPAPADSRDRRASPAPGGHTVYQEVGPNGQTYRVETTVRTTTSSSNGMSPADIQNMLQSADASQATRTIANAMNNVMQRSASAASLQNRTLNQPGVTVPILPGTGSRAGSGRTTPFGANGGFGATPGPGQEVYILSSPEGPRALLVNNSTAETYYTPRLSSRRSLPRMNPMMGMSSDYQRYSPGSEAARPAIQQPNPLRYQLPPPIAQQLQTLQPQPQAYQQAQAQAQVQMPVPNAQQHPHAPPPPAEGQPAVQAQMGQNPGHPQINHPLVAVLAFLHGFWPHAWLVARLAFFVYIFTSPGASWSRWLTILGVALFIFILSTGALNGVVAEHIMRPVGRHLDNILPALDGGQRRENAQRPGANQQGPQAAGPNPEPRPAQMADRLLNERQAREGWFTGQFRRIERASLLFLASIAPGVAERHIAHLEAEAARARREAEEAARAAAEAAEAANQSNEAQAEGGEGAQEGSASQAQGNETNDRTERRPNEPALQGREREPDAAPEPLIAI